MKMRLQHVSIPRPPGSDTRTRAFYGELLGLHEIEPPSALQGVIWFTLGDAELHVFEQAAPTEELSQHVCLEVEDVRALRVALEREGVPTEDTVPIPGRPRFFARDPFGNRLEFTQIESDYRSA